MRHFPLRDDRQTRQRVPGQGSQRQSASDWRQTSASPRSTRRRTFRLPKGLTRPRSICGGVLVCLVLLAVACTHLAPQRAQQTGMPGGVQQTTTPVAGTASQATPTSGHAPSPTPAMPTALATIPLAALSPTEVATRFLVGYFTWQPAESDSSYVDGWQSVVVPNALALCIKNAPRLLLDEGTDSAASGGALRVAPGALQLNGQQAQLSVSWTVQVLPAGGELARWQNRLVQATVALIQGAGSLWQIGGVLWTSNTSIGGN